MNSDEYHTFTLDNDNTNYNMCKFCGQTFGEHEQACPHNPPTDDNPVYQQLKEPWTEAP